MFGHLPLSVFEIFVLCLIALRALAVAAGAVLAVAAELMRTVIAMLKTIRRQLRR